MQKREEELGFIKETSLFFKEMAKKLNCSQSTVNKAMVIFLKYTRIYSFTEINKFLVAASCLLLAAKCNDQPVPIEYLVEWYIALETKRINKNFKSDFSRSRKEEYSQIIQEKEFDILCEIGFDVEIELPNKYVQKFAASTVGKKFAKSNCSKFAYMFVNDSFLTTCSLYYPPECIAAACIMMAYIYIGSSSKSSEGKFNLEQWNKTEWYKYIDESLDLETIIEAKDEIKKCYNKKASSS